MEQQYRLFRRGIIFLLRGCSASAPVRARWPHSTILPVGANSNPKKLLTWLQDDTLNSRQDNIDI